MDGELLEAWTQRARAASAWRDGEPIGPVLEALAMSSALELTGDLSRAPSALREALARAGRRALLLVGAPAGEEAEATVIAAELARDGLRALAGQAPAPDEAGDPPSPRELARLLGGRLDGLEAASIARRARASEQARRELAWAIRLRQAEEPVRVRLAAADGGTMRDPSEGRRIAELAGAGGEGVLAEAFEFEGGAIAIYAGSGEAVRVEGSGVRTEAMQAGYWLGRLEGAGPRTVLVHVGERALELVLGRDPGRGPEGEEAGGA